MTLATDTESRRPPSPLDRLLRGGRGLSAGSAAAPSGALAAAGPRHAEWPVILVLLAVGLAALVALYWPVVAAALRVWEGSTSYNHCFLIPLISGYLLWERRAALARMRPQPVLWPIAGILGLSLAALAGHVMSILEIQQFALVGMMQAFVLSVVGWRLFKAMLFPMLYLFFMVPTGEFLVPRLQDFTAAFVVLGLQMVQIPVFLDGVFIRIPNGLFEVAEACAGLRFLIANVAFGFLFAHLMYSSWRKRVVFVALSFIVPIFANGLRAFGIVMIAHLSDNKLAAGVDHIVYGWGFFVAIMLAMMWVGLKFRDPDAGAVAPSEPPRAPRFAVRLSGAVFAFAALVAAAAAPAAAYWLEHRRADHAIDLAAPQAAAPWRLAPPAGDGWRPTFAGADAELAQAYLGPGGAVHLYIAYFATQRQGAKIVSAENRLEVEDVWRRARTRSASAVIDGQAIPVSAQILTRGQTRRVAWTVFWVDRQFTASGLKAKLLGARGTLLSGHPQAAAVVLAADVASSEEEAEARMQDLLRNLPPLAELLGRAAGR